MLHTTDMSEMLKTINDLTNYSNSNLNDLVIKEQ